MLFDRLDTVVELMRRTSTRTGLRTTVHVIRRLDETGQKATDEIKAALRTQLDNQSP